MASRRRYRRKNSLTQRATRWLLLGGATMLVALAVLLYKQCRGDFYNRLGVDRRVFPIVGIDISRYNGHIDFDKVRESDVSFVYIKSSEGANYRDKHFARNAMQATQAGLKVGAYHFFRKSVDGKQQAVNFMKAVAGVNLDLPLVIDVEDWNNDKGVSNGTVIARLKAMIEPLKQGGHKVMIYTNQHGYDKWIKDHFAGEMLWLCTFKPPHKVKVEHHIQQYSHWGTIEGVKGEVDLNVFNGSRNDWNDWLELMHKRAS